MARRVGGAALLRRQRAILGRPDSRPTPVVVGDADAPTPSDARDMRRGIPDSVLHLSPHRGHLPPW